ncbi:MAG: bifunctional methylenetetrahydrofolate dehydrogenase/methenyltetrahydrofolate cyclohydrolase FolD [Bryobacteraceae bacterium]
MSGGTLNTRVLDGRRISQEIQQELRPRIDALRAKYRAPALAVVLVGDDPASQIYVRNKIKACQELGIHSLDAIPAASITNDELLAIIQNFNNNPEVDGILVQTPLPEQVDSEAIVRAVDPSKDADGFHPFNVGMLVANRPGPRACTPAGIIEMLKRYQISITGKRAVIVGRSDIVGKPMALMLMHENATVTICHSRTQNLAEECRRADLLVVAMGKPAGITAEYIKPGAVAIDVGMNRITNEAEVRRLFSHEPSRLAAFAKNGSVLVGDVEPLAMQQIAGAYTPVPGGVGPLTIAMLMANTVALAEQHLGC